MKQVFDNRWPYLARLLVLALAYTFFAKLALSYFSANGVVSIVWPASGLALAALLVGGKKYWSGVFIGALAGNFMQGSPFLISLFIATGSTLGALTCVWLLARVKNFDTDLKKTNDFFWLSITASVGACISAVVGVTTLFLTGALPRQAVAHNILNWWQGDALGIILVTSLILVWRQLPREWITKKKLVETVVCFSLAFLVGQVVFFGWFHHVLDGAVREYWMFFFVTWAAVRFGRHGALLIITMAAIQKLLGIALSVSVEAAGQMPSGLLDFWIYIFAMTVAGLFLAVKTDEKKQAETALEQGRNLFDKIAQRVPGVIYQFKLFPDGRSCFPFASEAIHDIYEVMPDDVAQDASSAFARIHPEDYDDIVNSIQESARTLDIWKHEFRVVLPKQGVRWRLGESKPERLKDGSVLWHGFITDITDRKSSEERILRLTKLYKAQNEINQAIVRMEQKDELFPLLCRCAVEFGGMMVAWVGTLDESTESIEPVSSHGDWKGRLNDLQVSMKANVLEGQGATATAMRENKSVIINDFFNNPMAAPWRSNAEAVGWKSVAAFPIQRADKPFSVLTVCHEKVNAFDKEAIELLEEMAVDVSFALDNFDRETQRKAVDESLKLAASVYEASTESIMITNADNMIIAVNPAFTKVTGYLPEEVISKTPRILKSGRHDEAFYKEMWSEIQTKGHWHGEVWDRRKNGEIYPKWLVINAIPDDEGNIQQHVAMFTDISQKKEAEELIWQQANFDFLTKLPNRQMFHDRLEQGIMKSHRAKRPLALMLLDLDRFKEVNDTLGHDKGDLLLIEASQRLISCVRETDTVARLGGDEFIVILENLNDPSNVERVAQNILQKLREPFQLGNEVAYVSASIGVTLYPTDATEIEALIKNADQAMYAAKSQGRNRHSYFTPSMQWASQMRVQIANDLRNALVANQFWVAYQPIIELKNGNIHKAEALIRWQHPQRGLVSPGEFIPVAEDTGLINDIGEWVFRESAKQVSLWRETIHPEFQISINKSPVQFRDVSSGFEPWPDQLQKLKLPGQSIVVEITEGMLMDASDTINSKLLEFRDAGIQVSLDDFGTGYSSLSYLKKFDIDYLKIDQSFTRNLIPGSDDMALCEAIIVMAHKLGMKVIAEGIETIEQRDLLLDAGCDYGQGYFFSKPIAASEFERLIIRDRLAG